MKLPSRWKKQTQKNARKQLAAWLAERELSDFLRDDTSAGIASGGLRYGEKQLSVRPGDVCLLKPSAAWGPLYVLILEKTANEKWRVVPFGRYATPAVPGEWATGLKASPLRVLCVWNAREISADHTLGGPARRLSAKQLDDACSVYRHVMTGDEIPDRLSKRLGPMIVHPADPRYSYLDEERERLDDHLAVKTGKVIVLDNSSAEWLLAAEGRPRYGK